MTSSSVGSVICTSVLAGALLPAWAGAQPTTHVLPHFAPYNGDYDRPLSNAFNPVMGDDGRAVFVANANFLPGIYAGDGINANQAIVERGDAIPGFPGETFVAADLLGANGAGSVLFSGDTNNRGLFKSSASGTVPVALVGGAVPGSDKSFASFRYADYSNSGAAAFNAGLSGPTNNTGIYYATPSSLQKVVQQGDFVLAANGAVDFSNTFGSLDNVRPVLNEHTPFPSVAFSAPTTNGGGVFLQQSFGAPARIAFDGQTAPGGGTFQGLSLSDPSINNNSHVAFRAGLSGDAAGIYVGQPGVSTLDPTQLTKVVKTGDNSPEQSMTFALLGEPFLTHSGEVLFTGGVRGPEFSDTPIGGLFRYDGTSVSTLFLNGTEFNGEQVSVNTSQVAFNDLGQAAFMASIGGDSALFFYDPTLGMFQVARVGATEVPGSGQVANLDFAAGTVGRTSDGLGINQVAYSFGNTLGGGTGPRIAIWTVPEPGGLAVLATMAAVGVLRRRCR